MKSKWLFSILLIAGIGFLGVHSYATDATTNPMPVRSLIPELDDTFDYGSEERAPRKIFVGPNDAYIDEAARQINFPVGSFTTAGILMSGSSSPKLVTNNSTAAVVWITNDSDSIEQSFQIPDDYHSGGRFACVVDQSGGATDMAIDFAVYVTSIGDAWDASATNQTAVALSPGSQGSPEEVLLNVTTDFASLVAGQEVVVSIWREVGDGGSGYNLELSNVRFEYNY